MQDGEALPQALTGFEQRQAMISASSGSPATSSRIRSSNLTLPMIPTLSPKLRSRPRMSFSMAMAFSCNNLRAVSRARSVLAGQRLHMHGSEQVDAHHLSDAASIVAVGLVHLRLQERLGVARLDADDRQPGRGQPAVEPLRQRPGFEPDPLEPPGWIPEHLRPGRLDGWSPSVRDRPCPSRPECTKRSL